MRESIGWPDRAPPVRAATEGAGGGGRAPPVRPNAEPCRGHRARGFGQQRELAEQCPGTDRERCGVGRPCREIERAFLNDEAGISRVARLKQQLAVVEIDTGTDILRVAVIAEGWFGVVVDLRGGRDSRLRVRA